MPKRSALLFLADILESIDKVQRYTADMSFEEFAYDDMTVDAVVRNLEIIGEAARQVSPELRELYPSIDWVAVVGFRNVVIHEYFDVDLEIVWTIATQRLSQLQFTVQEMIESVTPE